MTRPEDAPKLSRLKYRIEATMDDEPPGTVLRVADTQDFGKRYVLKIFDREGPEDDSAIAAARAAVEASSRLNHPALVAYHDFREKRSWFRLAGAELLMEYVVDGRSLDVLGQLPVGKLVAIYREVAGALAQMHRRKVFYGDLRPSHVMVTPGGRVKLLGYGLSLAPAGSGTRGSKPYMAPEQIKDGTLTEKTDLYNLGACLYHGLTGQPANVGKRTEGEIEKISTPSALNPAVPGSLNKLVVACLQTHPPRRPQSAYDVKQQLDAVAQELGVEDDALAGLGPEPEA
jgi:serine/threonine-protein kinase